MMAVAVLLMLFAQAGPPAPQAPMKQNRAPVAAPPAPHKEPQSPDVDRLFAVVAIQGNNAELDLAHLAVERGSANEVKGFAAKMLSEHQGLMDELMPVLQQSFPAPPERLSPANQLALRHLQAVTPVDFDQQYILSQIAGHLQMLMAFQTEAENGTNPQIKEIARKWMPTIQAHLQLAVDITKHVGGASPFKQ